MTTTVRLDTLRNQMQATGALIVLVEAHLTDLDHLAYERHRDTGAKPKVAGGARDYSLDNHGNPDARAALSGLKGSVQVVCEQLAASLHECASVIRAGGEAGQGRRLCQPAEHADALAAQARRIARGEQTGALLPQPRLQGAITNLERRLRAAEQRTAEVQRTADRYRQQRDVARAKVRERAERSG